MMNYPLYDMNYKDFEDILPPHPPLNLEHSKMEILPYLEWLEFKESMLWMVKEKKGRYAPANTPRRSVQKYVEVMPMK